MKIEITVIVDINDETGLQSVFVGFPKEQIKISVEDATHMLISGASLLIKSCGKTDIGIKDYELMKDVYTHLAHEFSSTSSFDDATIDKKGFKSE